MLFGLFENYSSTYQNKKAKFKSLVINKPSNDVFSSVVELMKKERFTNIQPNEDYLEIYGEKYGFELTVQIAVSGLKSLVDLSVYGEKKRGRTRPFLKKYISIFKENFK